VSEPEETLRYVQGEDAVPVRAESAVLGVRLSTAVDQLQHAVRVARAAYIGRRQSASRHHCQSTHRSGVVSGTTVRALVMGRFSQKKIKIELKDNAKR